MVGDLSLHGAAHTLTLSVTEDEMHVACELTSSGNLWKGSFTSACARGVVEGAGHANSLTAGRRVHRH